MCIRTDDSGGPEGFKRGFHHEDYQTEQQHQQSGYNKKIDPFYGADLPLATKLKPRESKDTFAPETGMQSKDWATNTQLTTGQYKPLQDERLPYFTSLNEKDLASYRDTWTSDNAAGRLIRFQTEAQRASNEAVAPKFHVNRVRFMPGTPAPVEKLREKLLQRFGILAFSSIRAALGGASVTGKQLQLVLSDVGLEVSRADFCMILAFFTQTDVFEAKNFMRIIVAQNPGGIDVSEVTNQFKTKFPEGSCSIDDILACINYDVHADLATGLQLYIKGYADPDTGLLSVSGFTLLHQDLAASSADAYAVVINNIWKW
jgi:hypothetical protein